MLSYTSTVVATSQQVSCDLSDEATILCLKNGKYYGLSQVGARIWELLAEKKTVQEVHSTLVQEYEVDAQECRRDLLNILQELNAEGLVEIVHE